MITRSLARARAAPAPTPSQLPSPPPPLPQQPIAQTTAPHKASPQQPSASERPRPFPCPEPGCEARFPSKTNARRHQATHALTNDFVCQRHGCGGSFKTAGYLETHERRHKRRDREQDKQAREASGSTDAQPVSRGGGAALPHRPVTAGSAMPEPTLSRRLLIPAIVPSQPVVSFYGTNSARVQPVASVQGQDQGASDPYYRKLPDFSSKAAEPGTSPLPPPTLISASTAACQTPSDSERHRPGFQARTLRGGEPSGPRNPDQVQLTPAQGQGSVSWSPGVRGPAGSSVASGLVPGPRRKPVKIVAGESRRDDPVPTAALDPPSASVVDPPAARKRRKLATKSEGKKWRRGVSLPTPDAGLDTSSSLRIPDTLTDTTSRSVRTVDTRRNCSEPADPEAEAAERRDRGATLGDVSDGSRLTPLACLVSAAPDDRPNEPLEAPQSLTPTEPTPSTSTPVKRKRPATLTKAKSAAASMLFDSRCSHCGTVSPRTWSTFLCPKCGSTERRNEAFDLDAALPPVRMEILYTGYRADLGGSSFVLANAGEEGMVKRTWKAWADGAVSSEFQLSSAAFPEPGGATADDGGVETQKMLNAGVCHILPRSVGGSDREAGPARKLAQHLVATDLPYRLVQLPLSQRCQALSFSPDGFTSQPDAETTNPLSRLVQCDNAATQPESTMHPALLELCDYANGLASRCAFAGQRYFDAGTVVLADSARLVLGPKTLVGAHRCMGIVVLGSSAHVVIHRLPMSQRVGVDGASDNANVKKGSTARRDVPSPPAAAEEREGETAKGEGDMIEKREGRRGAKRLKSEAGAEVEAGSGIRLIDAQGKVRSTRPKAVEATSAGDDERQPAARDSVSSSSDGDTQATPLPVEKLEISHLLNPSSFVSPSTTTPKATTTTPPATTATTSGKRKAILPHAVLSLSLSHGDVLNLSSETWRHHTLTLSSRGFGVWGFLYAASSSEDDDDGDESSSSSSSSLSSDNDDDDNDDDDEGDEPSSTAVVGTTEGKDGR